MVRAFSGTRSRKLRRTAGSSIAAAQASRRARASARVALAADSSPAAKRASTRVRRAKAPFVEIEDPHGVVGAHGLSRRLERCRRLACGSANGRQRRHRYHPIERPAREESRCGERLTLGGLEIVLASQHLGEHGAAKALFGREAPRLPDRGELSRLGERLGELALIGEHVGEEQRLERADGPDIVVLRDGPAEEHLCGVEGAEEPGVHTAGAVGHGEGPASRCRAGGHELEGVVALAADRRGEAPQDRRGVPSCAGPAARSPGRRPRCRAATPGRARPARSGRLRPA